MFCTKTRPVSSLRQYIENRDIQNGLKIIAEGKADFSEIYKSNFYEHKIDVTLLIAAIINDMEDVALALIATGYSRPEYVNKFEHETALTYACQFGMAKVALALILKHCDKCCIGHVTDSGSTALIYAINGELPDVAIALLKTGLSNPGHIDNGGCVALNYACDNKLSEVALMLIATGLAKPETINVYRNTPLMGACFNEMEEVALALISVSNVGNINDHGATALMYAVQNKMTKVALALIATGKSNPRIICHETNTTVFFTSCKLGLDEVVMKLIEDGVVSVDEIMREKPELAPLLLKLHASEVTEVSV